MYSAASASFTAGELARQIKQGNSTLVFCSEDAKTVACEAAGMCGLGLERVVVLGGQKGNWTMESVKGEARALPSNGKIEWERITDGRKLEESLICLLYSSGTTGIPKGEFSGGLILLIMIELMADEFRCGAFPQKYRGGVFNTDTDVERRYEKSRSKR